MATGTLLDSPALVVTALVTVILVIGIKESASFNAAMVVLKLAIVLLVTRMVPYNKLDINAPVAGAFKTEGPDVGAVADLAWRRCRNYLGGFGNDAESGSDTAGDGS